MHPFMTRAIARGQELITEATAEDTRKAARKVALKSMSKQELIDLVTLHEKLDVSSTEIGELCSAILCEPECAYLSYDMIQAMLHDRIPGIRTNASNVAWYSSHYMTVKGRDVQLRVGQKEITKLLFG